MKKIAILLTLMSLVLFACENSNSNQVKPTPSEETPSTSPKVSETVSETSKPKTALTKQEILDFDLLRSDWSKEQIEEFDFEKITNDENGTTKYSNDSISYTFFDYFDSITTPAVVDVYGDIPGPRNIRIGNTLDEVLKLFPVEEDWQNNGFGVFYGEYDPDAESNGMSGRINSFDGANKEMTLLTEDTIPYLRIYFKNDIVTNYTFYLIGD